jgi:hypothetical protein
MNEGNISKVESDLMDGRLKKREERYVSTDLISKL